QPFAPADAEDSPRGDQADEADRRPDYKAGFVTQPRREGVDQGIERRVAEGQEALPLLAADLLLSAVHRLGVVDEIGRALVEELADDIILDVIGPERMAGIVVPPAAQRQAEQPR